MVEINYEDPIGKKHFEFNIPVGIRSSSSASSFGRKLKANFLILKQLPTTKK